MHLTPAINLTLTAHHDVLTQYEQVPTALSYIAKQDCGVNPCLLSSNIWDNTFPLTSLLRQDRKGRYYYMSDREFWQGCQSKALEVGTVRIKCTGHFSNSALSLIWFGSENSTYHSNLEC